MAKANRTTASSSKKSAVVGGNEQASRIFLIGAARAWEVRLGAYSIATRPVAHPRNFAASKALIAPQTFGRSLSHVDDTRAPDRLSVEALRRVPSQSINPIAKR